MITPLKEIAPEVYVPLLGVGTSDLTGQACYDAVYHALEIGYQYIDTSEINKNYDAINKAIVDIGVGRDDLFLTTKIDWNHHSKGEVVRALDEALMGLGTDYVDLFMMHWPNRAVPFAETLGAMEELRKAGKCRALGVCNATVHHLEDMVATGIQIHNHQFELRPLFYQKEVVSFCEANNISITAHSQFGGGTDLQHQLVQQIAGGHGRPPAEIVLSWLRAHGWMAIPRSRHFKNIESNLASLTVELNQAELDVLDSLPQAARAFTSPLADFTY